MTIPYKNLKLEADKGVKTFNFNGIDIEVKNHLSFEDKFDLIYDSLQKSNEEGLINELALDMYFHLFLVYLYTNIDFSAEKGNEALVYDELCGSGFMERFLAELDEDEYTDLLNKLNEIKENIMKYQNTAAAVLRKAITELPKNAEKAADVIKNLDTDKFSYLQEIAKKV
jgi:SAM-dependent methyltransferase